MLHVSINIEMHVSFQITVFIFFGYMLRSKTAESHGSSIFSSLRKCCTTYISGCTNLQFTFPPTVYENSSFSTFLPTFVICGPLGILTSVRWYIIVILIFISLVISNVEHLFTWVLVTCMSSLEKCSFIYNAHLYRIVWGFWYWVDIVVYFGY